MVRTSRLFAAVTAALVVAVGLVVSGPAGAASAATNTVGRDVSWPQCGKTLASGQSFAIVGVNGSLGNQTNPCLADQLQWASKSVGGTSQPGTQLYVLFANPGLAASVWPTSNTYQGTTPTNRYGTCTTKSGKPQVSQACSFMYGYARGYDDVTSRGVANPAAYRWWIDVETGLSYQTSTAQNRAALEGMIAGLQTGGVKTIGFYSTTSQWGTIMGSVASTSVLYGRSNWIAIGKSTVTKARQACSGKPFAGGKIVMVQAVVTASTGDVDRDVSCV